MNEVRVFDGQGNLKEILQPVFDYETARPGKKMTKVCCECGKTSPCTGNQKYCSPECGKAHKHRVEKARRANQLKARESKPTVPCIICSKPVVDLAQRKYCSETCALNARRVNAMNKRTKTNELIKIKRQEAKAKKLENARKTSRRYEQVV